jgi:CBS domain-containing protein
VPGRSPSAHPPSTDTLQDQLGGYPPFDSLGARDLAAIAAAARVEPYAEGDLILDAFAEHSTDVFVVLTGEVYLWHDPARLDEEPDLQLGPGGVFGYSAMLTERSVGPRVVAAHASEIARIPGDVATVAFVSKQGARFLAGTMMPGPPPNPAALASSGVEDLLRAPALVLDATCTAADAARAIGVDGRGYAAIRLDDGRHQLVTDASLRQRIIVDGLPACAPVTEVLDPSPPTAVVGDSAAELLLAMLDRRAQFVIVTDRAGGLRGVVALRDVSLTPIAVDVSLHDRLRHAPDLDTLAERARRLPDLLGHLLSGGLASGKVIAVNTTIRDAVVRRTIELVFARHPELSLDDFTWLSLGSNGRREAVLSSDIDSAAAFVDDTSPAVIDGCRAAFAEVSSALERAGLSGDGHGATASRAPFARTNAQWRAAAQGWIAAPEHNQGAIMISLLVDGRPIYGDPGLPAAAAVVGDLRSQPATLRLLLDDTLARRARMRSTRIALLRRPNHFDIKRHAILPVVNIARWAALSVGSAELGTADRLRAAAGSTMLPESQARTLIEVFEALQRLRLRYQLVQHADGGRPSDTLTMTLMSPIDRSVIGQAVREIASAQRRMGNVSSYVGAEAWAGPESS